MKRNPTSSVIGCGNSASKDQDGSNRARKSPAGVSLENQGTSRALELPQV
jgi:hypothetical protein